MTSPRIAQVLAICGANLKPVVSPNVLALGKDSRVRDMPDGYPYHLVSHYLIILCRAGKTQFLQKVLELMRDQARARAQAAGLSAAVVDAAGLNAMRQAVSLPGGPGPDPAMMNAALRASLTPRPVDRTVLKLAKEQYPSVLAVLRELGLCS